VALKIGQVLKNLFSYKSSCPSLVTFIKGMGRLRFTVYLYTIMNATNAILSLHFMLQEEDIHCVIWQR